MCRSVGFPRRFKDSQISIKNGEHYVIHENGTLEIHVAQPLNSGKYTCIATNNLGVRENHVFLEVKGQADSGGLGGMKWAIVWDIYSLCYLIPTRAHPYPQTARVPSGPERNERSVRMQSQTRPIAHPHHDVAQRQRGAARPREVWLPEGVDSGVVGWSLQ